MGDDSFQVGATLLAPRQARQRVTASCEGLSEDLRALAALLTSELVTNAVRHPAHASGQAAEILLGVHRTDQRLRVEVHDHDPRPVTPVAPAPVTSESGRGLDIVSQLASAWGCQSEAGGEGKTVWFELQIPTPDGATELTPA